MTTMHEKLGVGIPGTTSIGLETITTTEETRAIHLLHALGQGSDIPIVVATTTFTEIETLTKTEETKETKETTVMTGMTETPETILENLTTEGICESQHSTPSQSPTNAPRLLPNDTQETLTSTLPQGREQTATKTATKTPTRQENQIVKSYSGA
jgi:hypothetical protein